MDVKLYADIVRDIKNVNNLNAYDTHFNILSKKYSSIPEETLRSIISLWFQRKVTQNAWRVKEIKIYDLTIRPEESTLLYDRPNVVFLLFSHFQVSRTITVKFVESLLRTVLSHKAENNIISYKKLIASGTKDACLQIAFQLEYPPSLVAKIVLTNYLAEIKSKKSQINSNELKNLRKQQCPYCKSLMNSQSNAETSPTNMTCRDKIPSIKQHHDPRVELALNLFDDDDDEIGKYFLEKFTFSNDKEKKRGFVDDKVKQKSSKFFWQASSFEEMGEKNVKQFANVEKLFSNRLRGTEIVDRFFRTADSGSKSSSLEKCFRNLEAVESEIISSVSEIKLNNSVVNEESSKIESFKSNGKKLSGILESTISSNDCDNSSKLIAANDTDSTFDESLNNSKGPEMKICTCGSGTVSDTSDSDSEDSDEAYENFSVKELFENPSLIEDPVLARDVFCCTLFDDQYGPTADVLCSSSGITHEKLLEDYVRNFGLAYKTEDNLRGDGFDKTPDIILLVPVAVKNFVINWVESKALFADFKLHQDFEKKQFQNYVNRFGPGLVIYWQGYVSEVLKSDLVNKQIIISDRFPPKEHFTFVKSDKFKSWMR